MKKAILFALLCVCAVTAHAIENAKCYLQHEGNVTSFDASAINDALEAAVTGDVLFLGEGLYPSFTLTKQITVRGAGYDKTKINGYISISISGCPTLSEDVLVGLGINGSVYLETQMSHCTIRKCQFSDLVVSDINDEILIAQSKIYNSLRMSPSIKGLTINNSKINQVYTNTYSTTNSYTPENVCTYNNCNINELYNYSQGNLKGTFINCVIKTYGSNNSFSKCIFINTLFGFEIKLTETSSQQESYLDKNFTFENDFNCSYNAATLESKGYLGNDGTVVGIEGGTNPFSLDLNLPRITASKLQLDRENKVLNVNLKVTSK